jgi:NTP pyrophosphatase (non-canonical NTP hydrolase)
MDTADENAFIDLTNDLCADVYALSRRNGFHDPEKTLPHTVGMIVSELAEAIEADRKSPAIPMASTKLDMLTAVEEELADAVIRIMDYCGKHGMNLGKAIIAKHAYNQSRPFRHGKGY